MVVNIKIPTAKKDKFLAVINFVAIAGIAIGVMALIIVIGVMTGFDHDLREKIVGDVELIPHRARRFEALGVASGAGAAH